jgi:hypothetical protein
MKLDVKNKVLAFLKGEDINPKDLVELMIESELVDGTVIGSDADAWAEGAAAWVIVDGEQVPAPDGTHELTDGTTLTTEGGVVTAVGAVEMSEENTVEQRMEALENSFNELKTLMGEMLASQDEETKESESKVEELKKELSEAKEQITQLGKKPAVQSLTKTTPKERVKLSKPKKGASIAERVAYLNSLEN